MCTVAHQQALVSFPGVQAWIDPRGVGALKLGRLDSPESPSAGVLHDWEKQLRKGATVPVFYNPDSTRDAVLIPGEVWAGFLMMFVGLLGIAVGVYNAWRARRQ
jgi:hypothetical protein